MADKKIYIKEHNSLFDSPIVEEPKYENFVFADTFPDYDGASYHDAMRLYYRWLSSKVEVVGDHNWVDGQEVKEGIDYRLTGGHRKRNGDGTTSRTLIVAIPIKEKDNDVTSVPPNDSTPVVSLTASSGNSVEQISDRAEQIQKECHRMVEYILNNTKRRDITVQDATNVFIFQKIAELEFMLNKTPNVQECDARESEQSDTDGSQKK